MKTKRQQQKKKKREKEKKKELRVKRETDRLKTKSSTVISLPTANATTIYNLMKAEKIKGDFKDHVVIAGNRLIDWQGSYDIETIEGATIGVDGMAIVHKKNLKNILPEEVATKFWHPTLGRVGAKKRM